VWHLYKNTPEVFPLIIILFFSEEKKVRRHNEKTITLERVRTYEAPTQFRSSTFVLRTHATHEHATDTTVSDTLPWIDTTQFLDMPEMTRSTSLHTFVTQKISEKREDNVVTISFHISSQFPYFPHWSTVQRQRRLSLLEAGG